VNGSNCSTVKFAEYVHREETFRAAVDSRSLERRAAWFNSSSKQLLDLSGDKAPDQPWDALFLRFIHVLT
jgi:hypothetical protein